MRSLETDVQKRYRRLYTFLGSYLYQTWPEDYPSPDKVFDELSSNFSPRTDYGWSEREWLMSLRDRAVAELRRRGDALEEQP